MFVDSILQIVRSNVTNDVNVTELHYKTMGVFHIEHKKCIFTLFNCTPMLSIILPIWDVLAKLFETAIIIITQTHWHKLVHDLWKNIIMIFTAFHRHFLHYLDMISAVKRNSADVSLNFSAYSCFFFLFCVALLIQTYNGMPSHINDIS